MGFFSAVKKFFGQEKADQEPGAQTQQKASKEEFPELIQPEEAEEQAETTIENIEQADEAALAETAESPVEQQIKAELLLAEAPAAEAVETQAIKDAKEESALEESVNLTVENASAFTEEAGIVEEKESSAGVSSQENMPEQEDDQENVATAEVKEAVDKEIVAETWPSGWDAFKFGANAAEDEATAENNRIIVEGLTERQGAKAAMEAAQAQAESRASVKAEAEEIARQASIAVNSDEKRSVPVNQPDSDENALLLRLREAEPKLSSWLGIILEGQEQVNETFWKRLKFLLTSLEAPEAEADAFLADFQQWLERMEYEYIDEFRSELQYRLALALDLEDEEDERNRLLLKLSQGLAATREQLGRKLNALFASHGELNNAFWEEMEELFIMADLGYETSLEIVSRLKDRAARKNVVKAEDARELLAEELEDIFRAQPKIKAVNRPEVVLMMGVNGAGKTTTIAKLAHRDKMNGKKVLVAAADTFRAAAIEQLQVWAERAGVDFYAKSAGSDPASVAWEAMDYALKNDMDVVYVDTAGRLQTRVNLMEELGKIRQVLAKKHPGAPHRSMLVLDATTGQNALSQAKLFREAAGADEIALTKLDGTAKGGVAIAVAMQEKLPITYIGLGEKMEDLRPFNGSDFANALLES